ncbi:hypothetical protein Tco_0485783, partial [Tanacetum coccineum]
MFTLPKFPHQHCTYYGDVTQAYPGKTLIMFTKGNLIKDEEFNLFIDRLSMIQSFNDGNGNGICYETRNGNGIYYETRNGNGNGNLRGRLVRGYRFEAMT